MGHWARVAAVGFFGTYLAAYLLTLLAYGLVVVVERRNFFVAARWGTENLFGVCGRGRERQARQLYWLMGGVVEPSV